MKTRLLGVMFAALFSGSAMAADMPVYKVPPPIYFSWTGCYIGAHAGGLWARKDWIERTPAAPAFGQSLGDHDANGVVAGVQVGCDYQFAGGFVIGIQGDYGWTNAKGSDGIGSTFNTTIRSLATVTGRFGYAWDRFLGYVKGGAAWERDDHWLLVGSTGFVGVSPTTNVTRSGWTIGVGGEYAFTDFVSAFVEYNYYDFGTRDVDFPSFVVNGVIIDSSIRGIKETKSVARAGLNFRLGSWGKTPVAAKY